MPLDFFLTISVDTGGEQPHEIELYETNITHNLGKMAREAGIYRALWHGEGKEKTGKAGDIIEDLQKGLDDMKSNPDKYKRLDAPNGWGTYEQFVPFVEKVLEACKKHPKADIDACR